MESRGDNSIGERNSGTDSNKGNINFMEGTEVESNVALQNGNIYTNMSTKSKGDYTISIDARENIALEDGGFPLAGVMSSSHSDSDIRRLKPLLEIDNNSTKSSSSSTPCGREMMHSLVDERRIAGNTCLTMSLGLYQAKASDMDTNGPNIANGMNGTNCTNGTNGHNVYNMPGMFMSPFELNNEERNQFKMSGCANPRQLLQKHHHMNQLSHPDTFEQSQFQVISRSETPNASPHVPIRVARPPIEGRGRNQLLPRYWPRITDQELQQITARDSNSTITPLFEKMLSASDAGRIGRLVLPKACAEAYFPPISQPEGVSLKIQDVSGKDWVFQFRFWPNNNSRMYVLEGVTPCIQSMQLQAGDTVTFSRLDPEGKLVMGFRKAPSSLSSQETAGTPGIPSFINNGSIDGFPTISSLTGLLSQSVKNSEARANGHLNVSDTGYGWYTKAEKGGLKAKEGPLFQSMLAGDKKSRPPSSKNKRPSTDEAVEFRITWEEAQDLLRSPPNVSPNIVTIEGFVFEEYEEPPVFGKRTIFTSKILGPGEDQWAQCDDCGSWRKVPSSVFLPTRWVCADNVWDTERNSCNDPQEIDSEEIECLVQNVKDIKKQEVEELPKTSEPLSGLEALASAATDTAGENSTVPLSPATTTKHPRHRPGCSCIVCIQPPSGKGPKHKPTCTCNVCMTVKRRFKTLMMRRKKRQLEREAEHAARKKRPWTKEDSVGDVGISGGGNWKNESYLLAEGIPRRQGNLSMALPNMLPMASNLPPNANGYRFASNMPLQPPYASTTVINFIDEFKGPFDLNGQPERDEEMHKSAFRMSMMRLLQSASHPLESYLKEQGLTSLIGTQQQFMHPSMSFSRNVTEREAERHHNTMNYATTATSLERTQGEDHLYMTLGMPRFSTSEGSLPPTLMHY